MTKVENDAVFEKRSHKRFLCQLPFPFRLMFSERSLVRIDSHKWTFLDHGFISKNFVVFHQTFSCMLEPFLCWKIFISTFIFAPSFGLRHLEFVTVSTHCKHASIIHTRVRFDFVTQTSFWSAFKCYFLYQALNIFLLFPCKWTKISQFFLSKMTAPKAN